MGRTVAVIGGGYGGSATAKALDEDTDVVLIEPRDAFVHAAGSLRALVKPEWASSIFFPYERLLQRGRVVHERAVAVDPGGVTLASGERIAADYVVLATGSDYPYPAKPDTDVSGEALARLRATYDELAGAQRVLITGAGPVGLELSGEIKAVWPDKQVTVLDPAEQLVAGFDPALVADLHRQLDALGVEVRLGTALAEEPPAEPGLAKTFTVGTVDASGAPAGEVTADIWFRCYGVRSDTGYLSAELLPARTEQGRLRVTERLTVEGHDRVYALGDITDLAEAKMAGHAMRHAQVVAANILSQVRGEEPAAAYHPSPVPAVLLPLGPAGGVGQVPGPDGPSLLSPEEVARYKGTNLLVDKFVELFGTA